MTVVWVFSVLLGLLAVTNECITGGRQAKWWHRDKAINIRTGVFEILVSYQVLTWPRCENLRLFRKNILGIFTARTAVFRK
jgi:hypothetical protein